MVNWHLFNTVVGQLSLFNWLLVNVQLVPVQSHFGSDLNCSIQPSFNYYMVNVQLVYCSVDLMSIVKCSITFCSVSQMFYWKISKVFCWINLLFICTFVQLYLVQMYLGELNFCSIVLFKTPCSLDSCSADLKGLNQLL